MDDFRSGRWNKEILVGATGSASSAEPAQVAAETRAVEYRRLGAPATPARVCGTRRARREQAAGARRAVEATARPRESFGALYWSVGCRRQQFASTALADQPKTIAETRKPAALDDREPRRRRTRVQAVRPGRWLAVGARSGEPRLQVHQARHRQQGANVRRPSSAAGRLRRRAARLPRARPSDGECPSCLLRRAPVWSSDCTPVVREDRFVRRWRRWRTQPHPN